MKNSKTIITLVMLSSIVATGFANAALAQNNVLSGLTYEDSSDMFQVTKYVSSTNDNNIRSYGDDYNKGSIWSAEYEEYVNSDDFNSVSLDNADFVNHYIGKNPTATGSTITGPFIYNENSGEYHLQ